MAWDAIEHSISAATGATFRVASSRPVGGGCINDAALLEDGERRYFLKRNRKGLLGMFEAEAAGLAEITGSASLRVPSAVATGSDERQSWLVLEYIEFGSPHAGTEEALGQGLATMHDHLADAFGFGGDNFIGATPQLNSWSRDWIAFFGEHRLEYQLRLAAANGASTALIERGEQLIGLLPAFFSNYSPAPSLLHGDLWGGNWAADRNGQPVLFDPAAYYGDREADLAMTELFGGFSDRFYHSYRSYRDIDPGYATRKVLYNLYHVLNHFNLFGGGYARQAQDMIDRLISSTH